MPRRIKLADDGTLDTVLRCAECGEEFRGTWLPDDDSDSYAEWVAEFIREVEDEHECSTDLTAED